MNLGHAVYLIIFIGLLVHLGTTQVLAAVEELTINILTLPSTAGTKDHLIIQTEVGAICLGNIYNEANPNIRSKLSLKNVDREGKASWKWPIDPKQSKTRWTINIQCATKSKKGIAHQDIEIP
ncbi:hypothetical protein [Petrachloros mirabilis]